LIFMQRGLSSRSMPQLTAVLNISNHKCFIYSHLLGGDLGGSGHPKRAPEMEMARWMKAIRKSANNLQLSEPARA